jgi:hypothetical protein
MLFKNFKLQMDNRLYSIMGTLDNQNYVIRDDLTGHEFARNSAEVVWLLETKQMSKIRVYLDWELYFDPKVLPENLLRLYIIFIKNLRATQYRTYNQLKISDQKRADLHDEILAYCGKTREDYVWLAEFQLYVEELIEKGSTL